MSNITIITTYNGKESECPYVRVATVDQHKPLFITLLHGLAVGCYRREVEEEYGQIEVKTQEDLDRYFKVHISLDDANTPIDGIYGDTTLLLHSVLDMFVFDDTPPLWVLTHSVIPELLLVFDPWSLIHLYGKYDPKGDMNRVRDLDINKMLTYSFFNIFKEAAVWIAENGKVNIPLEVSVYDNKLHFKPSDKN